MRFKKAYCGIMLVFALILATTVQGLSTRAANTNSDLNFNGTEAICAVFVLSDKGTDKIDVTMELYQSNTVINTWNETGYGVINCSKTAKVSKGETYKLIVEIEINGIARKPITIEKTNG